MNLFYIDSTIDLQILKSPLEIDIFILLDSMPISPDFVHVKYDSLFIKSLKKKMKNYGFKKHRRFELEKKNFGKYSATGVYIFRNSTFKKFIYYFYSVMTLNPLIVEFIKSSDLFFLPNPKQIHPFILQHAPDSFFVLPSLENALISEMKKDDFEEQETFGFL